MPCFSLAVVSARVSVDAVAEFLQSAQALDYLRAKVSTLTGAEATLRTVNARGGHSGPTFEAVFIESAGLTVVLARGCLTVQGQDRQAANRLAEQLAGWTTETAAILLRERLIAKLAAKYLVTANGRDSSGARLVRLVR